MLLYDALNISPWAFFLRRTTVRFFEHKIEVQKLKKARKKMKQTKQAVLISIFCLLLTGLPGYTSDGKLPVIDGKVTVATVNDEAITLDELNNAIGLSHAERAGKDHAGSIDYTGIMNRLINRKLILLEARNIGIHELPEVKEAVEKYSQDTLMKLVLEEHVKDTKIDEEDVEKNYRVIVEELKIRAVFFENEEDAKRIAEQIAADNNFGEIVKKAVEEGIAKGENERFIKQTQLLPSIARLVPNMEVGAVSPVVSFDKNSFILFKLLDRRMPEDRDSEAWERAKREVAKQKKAKAAKEYYNDLKKRYSRINEELLESLDYESEVPGFEKLLEDKRIIAEIDGEEPITVGELTEALKRRFFHGIEKAIESKTVNNKKYYEFKKILEKRILKKEALKQNIDKTESYKNRVKEYSNNIIFESFLNNVIIPEIKIDVKDLENYYKKNSEEYTFPEMMRIRSLVFRQRNDATNALDKLIKGTDFSWLSLNAEGQVDKNTDGVSQFEGKLLTVRSLPEEVRKALSGAKQGDFRLYASPEGYFYILHIYDLIPAKPQPFEDAKKEITKRVFQDKVKESIEAYADKLREYYPVKIYAKDLQ
jgi:hypothetical protein